jgi:hypothetical protein
MLSQIKTPASPRIILQFNAQNESKRHSNRSCPFSMSKHDEMQSGERRMTHKSGKKVLVTYCKQFCQKNTGSSISMYGKEYANK